MADPSRGPGASAAGFVSAGAPDRIRRSPPRSASTWLGDARFGLVVMALVVGAGAGLAAAAFRWLIYAFTWLATGYTQFGQQGHAPSLQLPALGIYFVLVVAVLGGLLYGPLIQRFAPEARGHGVPEVMLAVAQNGGQIRPQVTIVKALASAICIGAGGSVGREGPIVQIGSALASTLGQLVRMPASRLRIIVACGAAGGIAATFNAPITGLFFGFEIVLREFSLDALFATSLAAVTGDLISRAFFGSAPFLTQVPHGLVLAHDSAYLLVVVLALAAAIIGVGFKTFLYWLEDFVNDVWKGRPEWARPAVGGIGLGIVLLVLPQMYGVGYPVMGKAIAGQYALWFVTILMLGKILAASLTLSIGGSGGVFAPSLFIGAMAGMAFGTVAHHLFGPAIGPPAMYAVVAMGGVFAAATQAPLTAIASVAEMTGNYSLTLPIMLTAAIAAALSKQLSYGSIYTTKLLRRGIDIERPKAASVLQTLTVADVMQPIPEFNGDPRPVSPGAAQAENGPVTDERWERLAGPVTHILGPQGLLCDQTLEHAARQLTQWRRTGLPVLSDDRQHLQGWLTRHNVVRALAHNVNPSTRNTEQDAIAVHPAANGPTSHGREHDTPLAGFEIIELHIGAESPALGRRVGDISWPAGSRVLAVTEAQEIVPLHTDTKLRAGEQVIVLTPSLSTETAHGPHRET